MIGQSETRTGNKSALPPEAVETFTHMSALMNAVPPGPPGSQGEMTCPHCGGSAWWGRAKRNGHLTIIGQGDCLSVIQ